MADAKKPARQTKAYAQAKADEWRQFLLDNGAFPTHEIAGEIVEEEELECFDAIPGEERDGSSKYARGTNIHPFISPDCGKLGVALRGNQTRHFDWAAEAR